MLPVHLTASDVTMRERMATALRRAGIPLTPEPGPDTVLVATGRTVDDALDACRPGHLLLIIADTFTPAGVLRAMRAGARVMLQSGRTTPAQLTAAVHAARHGDGRLPHDVLVRLVGTAQPQISLSPLTARQTAVLALTADGHSNAAIARSLSCSEHTIKNVIYDLMTRLQVRNRAHAVAHAVRAGLI
ncbi:LuxR C-terminal-related transcriptional regulator [Kibdelosporangium persicum]|uniref:Helix-turn-helix transcriptional regulator n=1 Tax=Kibdelosporangium persicum TaxID=2698649 RepID=A0ABX2FG67_9PSEU|nr:LuxR C-terminal-related transcriptional regulator [Kibdelosporangium persicum]NRN70401.1 Helix-turn-helix transcriptional regulator [Kibdelosporangium persicum]